MSRLPFEPTEEQRSNVETLSGIGVPQDDIAALIGCDPKTLRLHFREQLDLGSAKANAKVGQTLFKQATSGNNTAATIFWLKARAGWREKHQVELTGKDGGPVTYVIRAPTPVESADQWLHQYAPPTLTDT